MTGYFQAFELDELEKKHAAAGSPYSEFLRRRGVSMGMYTLPAGTADHQHPHSADEVYIVLRGRGTLRVVDTDHEVKAGSIVSVDRGRGSPLHRRCRGPADPGRLRAAGHPRRLTARPECGPQRPRCPRLQPPTPARRLCGPRCRRGVGPCRGEPPQLEACTRQEPCRQINGNRCGTRCWIRRAGGWVAPVVRTAPCRSRRSGLDQGCRTSWTANHRRSHRRVCRFRQQQPRSTRRGRARG